MINSKEVIITPNDDNTYKLEFIGCKFVNNGEEVEAKIIFPKITKTGVDAALKSKDSANVYDFALATTDEEPEIFTIYIPE